MAIIKMIPYADSTSGSHGENAFLFDTDEEVDESNATDVLEDLREWFINELLPTVVTMIVEEYLFSEIQLLKNTDVVENTWVSLGSIGMSETGSSTAEEASDILAARCQADCDSPGRKGSKFVGGLADSAIIDGVLDTTPLAQMINYLIVYTSGFVGGDSGILFSPGVLRNTGNFSKFTGGGSVTTVVSNQVRRKRGVGV